MASVHEHPAVEGVALLAGSLSTPRCPIRSCEGTKDEVIKRRADRGGFGCVSSSSLTAGLGEILVELLAVLIVDDVVDAGVDQLFLLVLQVLRHVVRHEHDAALPVDNKQEAVQGLNKKQIFFYISFAKITMFERFYF